MITFLQMQILLLLFRLITTGYKRTLKDTDLWEVSDAHKVNTLREKFEEAWSIELEKWKR